MFLDESENLSNSRNVHRTLMSILNAGFSKNGIVPRVVNDKSIHYNVYCPKMFGGINNLHDVLDSRTIHIQMLRKLPSERVDNYNETNELLEEQECLREHLYLFGLQYCYEVKQQYENIRSIKFLEDVENRTFDIWAPLFVIGSVIDKEYKTDQVSESLKKYLNTELGFHNIRDEQENETSILLGALDDSIQRIQPVRIEGIDENKTHLYLTEDLFNNFNRSKDFGKQISTKHKLTSLLREKIGVVTKNITVNGKTKRVYVINLSKTNDLAIRYNCNIRLVKDNELHSKEMILNDEEPNIGETINMNNPLNNNDAVNLDR